MTKESCELKPPSRDNNAPTRGNSRYALLALQEINKSLLASDSLFSELGFSVVTASDGREAISRFIESRPEIVVLEGSSIPDDSIETASSILSMRQSTKVLLIGCYDKRKSGEAERIGVEIFLKEIATKSQFDRIFVALANLGPTRALVCR